MGKIRISFCTTCHNRAYQFKRVFAANAAMVAKNRDLEWIVLNYCSEDDLHEFMMEKLPSVSRRIVYAREAKKRPWHASVAKNMAHRIASGSILMNLDCDNLIRNSPSAIRAHFARGGKVLHLSSGIRGDGTFGRIAVDQSAFYALGGYDESFYPMGQQDWDLLARAASAGLVKSASWRPCPPDSAVKNTKDESVRYCRRKGLSWNDMNLLNRKKSLRNLAARRLVANVGRGWPALKLELFTGDKRDRRA